MSAFDLDRNLRWLFCMTHPDDEVAICAWIKRLTESGCDVFLSWTHHTDVRRSEALAAAEILGIGEDRLFFHGAADNAAVNDLERLYRSFREMMALTRPYRVVSGAFEQGHIDHDATNMLVNSTYEGPVFEVPLYHTYLTRTPVLNRFADPHGQEIIRLGREERRFKTDLAKAYPSQTLWRNVFWHEVREVMSLRPPALNHTERLRIQTHRDFRKPNLPEPLAAKVAQCSTWQRWLSAISESELDRSKPLTAGR